MEIEKISLIKEKLENKMMYGMDGVERKVLSHFKPEDFGLTDEGIYVHHSAVSNVVRKLFEVKDYRVNVNQCPEKSNDWCATVVVHYSLMQTETTRYYHVSSCADCRKDNAPKEFGKYSVAIAETRASGRALKNLLGLDLCTFEEIDKTIEEGDVEIITEREKITEEQKKVIEIKFLKGKNKSIEDIGKIFKKKIESLDGLLYHEALTIIKKYL